MKINLTDHFEERCLERADKPKEFVVNTFEYIIKKVLNGKVKEEQGRNGKFVVRYGDYKYVYTKKPGVLFKKNNEYTIITFGMRTPYDCPPENIIPHSPGDNKNA